MNADNLLCLYSLEILWSDPTAQRKEYLKIQRYHVMHINTISRLSLLRPYSLCTHSPTSTRHCIITSSAATLSLASALQPCTSLYTLSIYYNSNRESIECCNSTLIFLSKEVSCPRIETSCFLILCSFRQQIILSSASFSPSSSSDQFSHHLSNRQRARQSW